MLGFWSSSKPDEETLLFVLIESPSFEVRSLAVKLELPSLEDTDILLENID